MKFSKIETGDKLTIAFGKVNDNFSKILDSVSLQELNDAIDKLSTKTDLDVLSKNTDDKISQLENNNITLRANVVILSNLVAELEAKFKNVVTISQFNSQIANINSIITK
jgi:hypothetical protein